MENLRLTPYQQMGRAWLVLSLAFCLHALEEAATGFLPIYNQTLLELAWRAPWLPLRPLRRREWIRGLEIAGGVLFGLSPGVFRGARWARPAAYGLSVIMVGNAALHLAATMRGRTVHAVRFKRPMPGSYTAPLLLLAAATMLKALRTGPANPRRPD
jgi:hypothetical protein